MPRTITFNDINKRVLASNSNKKYQLSRINEHASKLLEKYTRPEDIIRQIQMCCEASFAQTADTTLSLYESLYTNPKASSGHIAKAANIICDKGLLEVASAAEINEKLKKKRSAVSNAKAKVSRSLNKMKRGETSSDNKKKNVPTKEEALYDGYSKMINESEINAVCHRIIGNYNMVSKRFNIDSLFKENTVYNGVYDTVLELCKLVDTYSTYLDTKFNTVIECAYYGLSTFGVPFEKKEILEAAVDYFGGEIGGTETCRSVLEDSLIYNNPEDLPLNSQIIHEEEPKDDEEDPKVDPSTMMTLSSELQEYASGMFNDYSKIPEVKTVKEDVDFNKIFADWKKNNEGNEHKENGLKSLISKLYTRTPEQVVEEVPSMLKYIRGLIIIGSCAIHPIVGAVLFVADQFVKNSADKKETNKMITCFRDEMSATKAKINSCKNEEEKKKLKEYYDALEKGYGKIEDHYLELANDDEQAKYYDSASDSFDDIDDDFDWDDDDDDFNFDESASSITEAMLSTIVEVDYLQRKSNFPNVDSSFLGNIGLENTANIAEFCSKYPDCYNLDSVIKLYESYQAGINSGSIQFKNSLEKYRTKAVIEEALETLRNPANLDREVNIFESYRDLRSKYEGMQGIQMMTEAQVYYSSLLETSFMNKLKVAGDKLKRGIQSLSDKDKKICKNLDSSVDHFTKKCQDAMTNDNRESIIKGSLLPSASKIIKMGIVSAGLTLVGQPVLAVIGVLGYIGCSKKMEARQRQEIVDDIEVELKMCDKYIDEAERKEDKDALRNLYKIQRNLQRQQQRIKYHMKINAQPVHDIPKAGY